MNLVTLMQRSAPMLARSVIHWISSSVAESHHAAPLTPVNRAIKIARCRAGAECTKRKPAEAGLVGCRANARQGAGAQASPAALPVASAVAKALFCDRLDPPGAVVRAFTFTANATSEQNSSGGSWRSSHAIVSEVSGANTVKCEVT